MEKNKKLANEGSGANATHDNEIVISIKHIKKSFGSKEVLSDVSMELHKSENLVILGRSGTGKSVTIKCVVGLLAYDSGNLTVFGEEVNQLNEDKLKELRIKVGFLFQNSALYDSMSVRENLEFPLIRVLKIKDQAKLDEKVEEVLQSVGLKDAINKMPSDLSGGMRKRVGLARTLILNPEVMLYDEPTTGLDPITSREISELILEMQKKYKTSSIIITHDMACAEITSDRILLLSDGKFIAEGAYNELKASKNEAVIDFFK